MTMIKCFNIQWDEVPIVSVDTETTGTRVGHDRAVQVALVRFERGAVVDALETLVNPGIEIPAEATAIHGITNDQVSGAPEIGEWFSRAGVKTLLEGAQPVAYNGQFDRHFVPPFTDPWEWPFLDVLSFVRKLDRFVSGKGRHKLAATCERHGIVLENAHSAIGDARATGELFIKLGRQVFPAVYTLGKAISWQMRLEAVEWERHHAWKAGLPPLDKESA